MYSNAALREKQEADGAVGSLKKVRQSSVPNPEVTRRSADSVSPRLFNFVAAVPVADADCVRMLVKVPEMPRQEGGGSRAQFP
jgi:hypothetical protein